MKSLDSTDRFGYEWENFSVINPDYQKQFLGWITPLKPTDFRGKSCLDAGCGIGRNSLWMLKYGAKKVTLIDFDYRTIRAAQKNLKKYKNSQIIYQSIYDLNYINRFDISLSIGVIHHLQKPKVAIKNLVKATKKNGYIIVWVYGYEGNEWIVKYINPVRTITSRIPVKLTNLIALLMSGILFFYTKLIPTKNEYLKLLKTFNFKHVYLICLDQLIPKIANYWTKKEAISLFNGTRVKNLKVSHTNNNSWTIIAQKI